MRAPNLVTNHYPIVHLGDFFRHMAPVPSPICHMFTQQLRFFTNFIKFSSFHACVHLFWVIIHPPGAAIPLQQLATHPTISPSTHPTHHRPFGRLFHCMAPVPLPSTSCCLTTPVFVDFH